ncbi:hypothetical protein [Priestia megaterium]|uniref:hypothetical protein n=1 Tax=Priestia megaterium TaxID=1404 RepID=UPI002E23E0EB|nr:hypothetical protein [Priestia megaterium]
MDLKLNIYNKKEITKTYVADTYDLMFGTVEDLLDLIDADNLDFNDNNALVAAGTKFVMGGLDVVKPLLKDIFEGLTDEELKNTKVKEITKVLIEVVTFSIAEMGKGVNSKN